MPAFTQATRPMAVKVDGLADDALLLSRLEGEEELSRPFHFRLELLAEHPVKFEDVLGRPATVRLDVPGCPSRVINGIISRLACAGPVAARRGSASFIRYRADLVPQLW